MRTNDTTSALAGSADAASATSRPLDRRRFLQRAALAGAGLVAGSVLLEPLAAVASNSGHCRFGAGCQARGKEAGQQDAVLALESEIGRTLGVVRRYSDWENPMPDAVQAWAASTGRFPYISWHARKTDGTIIPWASIANGSHDTYLRQQGQSLAAWGAPCYFNFHHEPENDTANGTAADFKTAFKHVRHVFDSVGATNLIWVCTLMGTTFRGTHGGADTWLPPVEYFTLLGADGYNRWPLIKQPAWRSFAELFDAARMKAAALGKGLLVGEYGCVEQTAGGYPGDPLAKANWFSDAATTLRAWPEVVGVSYSHGSATFGGKIMPYWVDSSAASLAAFKAMGRLSYFA